MKIFKLAILLTILLLLAGTGAFGQAIWNGMQPSTQQTPLGLRVSDGDLSSVLGKFTFTAQSVLLTANTTNYIYLDLSTNPPKLTVNTTGFPASNFYKIAIAVTNTTQVTALTDVRPAYNSTAFAGTGTGTANVSGTNCQPAFLSTTAALLNTGNSSFLADCYSGATVDVPANGSATAALAVGNTADWSGLTGTRHSSVEIDAGNLAQNPLHVNLPNSGDWIGTATDGTSSILKQFDCTDLSGSAVGGDSQFIIETQGTSSGTATSVAYLYSNDFTGIGGACPYLHLSNVQFRNHSGTAGSPTTSGIGVFMQNLADESGMSWVTVFDPNDANSVKINNMCCGSFLDHVDINAGNAGLPLFIEAIQGFSTYSSVFNHPLAGQPIIKYNDNFVGAGTHTGTFNQFGTYHETSNSNTTEQIIDMIGGPEAYNSYGATIHSLVPNNTSPYLRLQSGYASMVNVSGISFTGGPSGTWVYPVNAIYNNTTLWGTTAATCICTDNIGNLGAYVSAPAYFENLFALNGFTAKSQTSAIITALSGLNGTSAIAQYRWQDGSSGSAVNEWTNTMTATSDNLTLIDVSTGLARQEYDQGADSFFRACSACLIHFQNPAAADMFVVNNNSTTVQAVAYGTLTNCIQTTGTTSPANCQAAPEGIVKIAAAATTFTINTTAVTGNSRFWFTYSIANANCTTAPSNIAALIPPYVSTISAGVSFTIAFPVAPSTNPVCVMYGFNN